MLLSEIIEGATATQAAERFLFPAREFEPAYFMRISKPCIRHQVFTLCCRDCLMRFSRK